MPWLSNYDNSVLKNTILSTNAPTHVRRQPDWSNGLASCSWLINGTAYPLSPPHSAIPARTWLKRSNAVGLPALPDKPRSGRPATYPPPQVADVIATSLTPPEHLGLPFASWTLDRLAASLHEHQGIAIKRSRIDALL